MPSRSNRHELVEWITTTGACAVLFSLVQWLHTVVYNQPTTAFGDRALVLVFICVTFVVPAVLAGCVLWLISLRWPPLRSPFVKLLISFWAFLVFRGGVYLVTHGIYYDSWGIDNRWVAQLLRILQIGLVVVGTALTAAACAWLAQKLLARGPKATIAAVIMCFACLAFGLFWPFERPSFSPIELPEAYDVPRSTVIIGLDALTWTILDPLIESGQAPNFARLKDLGSWGDLLPFVPTNSPEIWTTMSTGEPPRVHGILSHTTFHFKGMREKWCFPHYIGLNFALGPIIEGFGLMRSEPISAFERRAPALWEIANAYGASSAVINWYATFPAESIDGIMVSDMWRGILFGTEPTDPNLKAKSEGMVTPPQLLDPIVARAPHNSAQVSDAVLRMLVETDSLPDVTLAYWNNPDSQQHTLWKYYEPEKFFGVDEAGIAKHKDGIINEYIHHDQTLGWLLDTLDDDTLLVVVSDHGAGPVIGGIHSGGHVNAPLGVLMLKGPNVKKGYRFEHSTPYDILPTILYLRGLPVASRWSGEILNETVEAGFLETHPPIQVPHFAMPKDRFSGDVSSIDREVSDELKEQLRALGYVD